MAGRRTWQNRGEVLRGRRLLCFALAMAALAALQGGSAEPASGFAIDKSRTFLGGLWRHGDESGGVHEPITRAAILRGMPNAPKNLETLMWAGVENVDVTHHFDSEYHFDSASVASFPERFTKAFKTVDRHFEAALGYANENPEFFKPTYGSYRQLVAAVPGALLAVAGHERCGGCATVRLRLRAAEVGAALVYLAPNRNPDPHAAENPDSVFGPFNPLKSCGLCGAGWGINLGYRLNFNEVEAAILLGVRESEALNASDPVRKRVERLRDALEAYRAFQELGHAFHATQDFFAHTNYVELMAGVAVESPIPAGTQVPVPQSRTGFSLKGLKTLMGAERFTKLESGAANAIWLGEGDYCLGSLYNPKTRIAFNLPTLTLPGVGKVGGEFAVVPGGKNPRPPKGLNYCHYHTTGAPGLNKDEPGKAEPSHANHAVAVQAATDMTAVLWKSFLNTVKRPTEPKPEQAPPNLSGTWKGQDGGLFVLKQAKGSTAVTWEGCSADGGKTWTHTFTGRIIGDSLVGHFKDHPPGQLRNEGDLALDIASASKLVWIAKLTVGGKTYTSFPTLTRTWTRAKHGGCPAPSSSPEPFEIASVSLPSSVVSGGARGDLSVTWRGNPTFPVKMVYGPDSCPPGINCTTPDMTFAAKANPLVFPGAIWCTGVTSTLFFDYSVYLEDAKGKRTGKTNADFTCRPG